MLSQGRMDRPLRRISECVTPLNWVWIALVIIPAIYVVFRPTLAEYAFALGVDLVATAFWMRIEGRIFQRLYPDSSDYFDGLDVERARALSPSGRLRLIESLFRFPTRRAFYCYLFSFVKCIPIFAVIVFAWRYEHPKWAQFALILGLSSINWLFFYCMVLVDNHDLASRWIARLHEAIDFSDAFEQLHVSYSRWGVNLQEWLLLSFLFLFTLILQLVMVSSNLFGTGLELAANLAAAGLGGLLLFSRAWFISRCHFTDRLRDLHARIEAAENMKKAGSIPLSTMPLLALFGQSINRLTRRITEHERELSTLVLDQAEKSRFRDLGEMAALLTHDLSGPLHVAQFSATQLLEEPEMPIERRKTYLHHLVSSLSRAVEQTTSLRSRIRNPESGGKAVLFGEAHENVLKLLKARMDLGDFAQVRFTIENDLANANLGIPRVDLIHILDNLYRYMIEALTELRVPGPEIHVGFGLKPASDLVEIIVWDNGSRLSADEFNRITAFYDRPEKQRFVPNCDATRGLGLRLTRRLVEVNGGDLRIGERSDASTVFLLILPEAAVDSPAGIASSASHVSTSQPIAERPQ